MIQEKNFPLRGRRPRSGNVFENHFLNRDNLGKMQLKTRKNVSSCIELEQYTKQSVFLYFPYISYGKRKMGRKSLGCRGNMELGGGSHFEFLCQN